MPREVSVRPASVDDVAAVQHVARAAWHATYDDVLSDAAIDQQVDEWYRDDVVADAIQSDDVVYLVAGDGDDVVGYASAGPSEQVADSGDEEIAQLYTIYVAPNYWGEGVGSRLFETAVERLRAEGYDALRMNVLEANDLGRPFYESYGYPVVEEGTTTIAGEEVDEVVYAGTL